MERKHSPTMSTSTSTSASSEGQLQFLPSHPPAIYISVNMDRSMTRFPVKPQIMSSRYHPHQAVINTPLNTENGTSNKPLPPTPPPKHPTRPQPCFTPPQEHINLTINLDLDGYHSTVRRPVRWDDESDTTAWSHASTSTIDLEKGLRPLSLDSIASLRKPVPLPRKKYGRLLRHARHTFLNVYRRLFTIVFLLNMIGLSFLFVWRYTGHVSEMSFLSHLATGASANILVALLIRQDYIINALFKATWLIPATAPLRLRRVLAKVYEYGGVHSGAAISSVVWFMILTVYLTISFASVNSPLHSPAILTTTYILLVILVALCITAYPRFRFSSHNTFENVHRYGGWTALAIFWAEVLLFAHTSSSNSNLGLTVIKLPAFWFLLVASLHTIYPWLLLHKLHVTAERLSDHATRLHFNEPVPCFVGLRISDAPLREWHSFAVIPARPEHGKGGSVLISNAGDWTKKTIDNPKKYYWVKGVPVTGVMCMARLFTRIVVVTTGSGIGPVLAVVQDLKKGEKSKTRIIWSAPSPEKTFGDGVLGMVRNVDPDAMVIDTRKTNKEGKKERPDLVRLAYEMFMGEQAEAVFVISNPNLTRKVVYGLESRGVPAFGPVWDS